MAEIRQLHSPAERHAIFHRPTFRSSIWIRRLKRMRKIEIIQSDLPVRHTRFGFIRDFYLILLE